MPKKYEHPPIIEAICEVAFDTSSEWDLAIPGLIYEQVKGKFPKRQQVQHFDILAKAEPGTFEHRVQQSGRVQFISDDGRSLLQIGPHFLGIHKLDPYISWEHFLPTIMDAVKGYMGQAKPKGISRVVLRYINEIVIPGSIIELPTYFDFYPYVGERLPQDYGAFITGIQGTVDEISSVLKIELAEAASNFEGKSAFLLDLSCRTLTALEPAQEQLQNWLVAAHGQIEAAFEGAIKPPLREIFGEVL